MGVGGKLLAGAGTAGALVARMTAVTSAQRRYRRSSDDRDPASARVGEVALGAPSRPEGLLGRSKLLTNLRHAAESDFFFKNVSELDFLARYQLIERGARILDAGSSNRRLGPNCVNVDIEPAPEVDVVCDINALPSSLGSFDAVVCNAVLQYCQQPDQVAREFFRVLRPGGYLFVDAPWVQPTCAGEADRLRFSEEALRTIFADFAILEAGPSIRPGAAFAFLGAQIAGSLTSSRPINTAMKLAAVLALWPLCRIRTAAEGDTAGAFYLIGRKPAAD